MRVLVTGADGFVGRHVCEALRAAGHEPVAGVHATGSAGVTGDEIFLELRDPENLRAALARVRPDVVVHLAAQASVAAATSAPLEAFDVNAGGTLRLFEAIRARSERPPRVVYVSSGEVYGARPAHELPLRENSAAAPATPYAASKLAGEAIALAWHASYGVPVVVARAFNHIGPGQSPRFAVPSFARGLAAIAEGGEPVLQVGNLEAQRDFLDVRDVARAYVALAERGADGEIYNVCSGRPVALREILRQLITIARVPVEVRQDPALMRANDVPVAYGDNAKLIAATGWQPSYALSRSLADVYADARAHLGVAR